MPQYSGTSPINFGALQLATAIKAAPPPQPIDWSKIIVTPPNPFTPRPVSGFAQNPIEATASKPALRPLSLYDQVNQGSTYPFTQNKIADNNEQASALLSGISNALDRTSGAIISPMSGLPLEKVNGHYVPQRFSEAVNKGAEVAFGPKVGPAAGLVIGMIGDPLNLIGGEGKSLTLLGKLHPDDAAFLVKAADSIKDGRLLTAKDWELFQHTLAHYSMETPKTQVQAADFIHTALASDFEKAMTKSVSQPATVNPSKVDTTGLKPQPRQANGWWDSFKKAVGDQRGFVKNPLGGEPRKVPSQEELFSKAPKEGALTVKVNHDLLTSQQQRLAKDSFGMEYSSSEKSYVMSTIDAEKFYREISVPGALPEGEGLPKGGGESVPSGNGSAKTGEPQTSEGKTIPTSEGQGPQGGSPVEAGQKSSSFPDSTINTKNYNISDIGKATIKKVVDEVKPQIQKATGKVLSNAEALKTAEQSSKILTKTVGRDDTLAWQASMLKARQALAAASESGTVDKAYIDNLLTIKTQGTDIARKLQSLSIGADAVEPTAKQAILEAVLKVEEDTDKVIKAAKGVDFNNLKEATKFYRTFIKPKAGEWLDLIRYNSMLSSPKTHIVNTASNFFNSGIIAPLEKALTGGLDFLGSAITGKPRSAYAGEGYQYAKGALSNIKDATFRFADVLQGKKAYTNLDTKNIPIATSGVKGAVVSGLSAPMKLLEGMDQFFTALAEGGQTKALEYRAGKGVNVGNIPTQAAKDAAYRLYRQAPLAEGEGHLLNAVDQFTTMIQRLRNNDNPIVSTVAKFTVPFLQTPMNIFKQGIEYSPVGFGTLPGAANKTEQLSKAIIGSSVFAGAATLLASNRITWGEPTQPADKANFRASGMQPYSVKIGDKWVSYQKLPPGVAFPLAMTAAIHDTLQNKKINDNTADLVLSGIAKYGQFLADQSYAKSIGDLLAAAKGGESGIEQVVSNYGQQVIPYRALGGWLARLTDSTQRKVDPSASFVDQQVQLLMMNIPGLSQKVPARVDASGNPIPQQFPVFNALSPVGVTQQTGQQEKQFQDYTTIGSLEKQNNTASKATNDQAAKEWQTIQSLGSSEEKKAYLTNIARTDPELAKKIITEAKKPQGLSPIETKLLGASTATRAAYIAQEFKTMTTKEEKRAYLQDLYTKKIATKEVIAALAKLLKQ